MALKVAAMVWVLNVSICSDRARIPETCGEVLYNFGPFDSNELCDSAVRDKQHTWPKLPFPMRYAYECFSVRK